MVEVKVGQIWSFRPSGYNKPFGYRVVGLRAIDERHGVGPQMMLIAPVKSKYPEPYWSMTPDRWEVIDPYGSWELIEDMP